MILLRYIYIWVIIIVLLSNNLYGQCNCSVDSLKNKLGHTISIIDKVDICNHLSGYYALVNEDSAQKYISIALTISILIDYQEGEIKALTNKGYLERIKGNFDTAQIIYESALKKSLEIDNKYLLCRIYLQMGIFYEDRAVYNLAFENYMNALHIFEQTGDTVQIIYTMNYIAGIYSKTNDLDKAFAYLFDALEIAETANDSKRSVMLINNIADIYSIREQRKKAMEMYKKALKINIRDSHFEWATINNQNIAKEYVYLEELDSAEIYLQKSLCLTKLFNNNFIDASILFQLGNLYTKRNELVKAEEYLYKADSIASKYQLIEILVNTKKWYAELYHKLNNYSKEAKYLREYKTYSDSLLSDKNTKLLTELKFKYNYEKKQKQQELKNQRTKYLSIMVSVFSISGFIILILLYFQQKSRVGKARIEKEKLQIQKENLEQKLELQNKEITASTMIQLQKKNLTNSIIEKLNSVKHKFAVNNHKIIDDIINELKSSMDENTWDGFLLQFGKVHESFFSSLYQISKKITLNEKRLCAFIRLKMTTKEIAYMTNANIRSIEMARYRLRKKLNMSDSNISLDAFLENL